MSGSVDELYLGQDIGNDRNVAGRIFLTDFIDGSIASAADGDVYVLRTEIGATYVIERDDMPAGVDIAFIDEAGVESKGTKSFTAAGTTQFFRITSEAAADYSFRIVKETMSENSGAGEAFTPGEVIPDVLNAIGDGDHYSMATTAGSRYGIIAGGLEGIRLTLSNGLTGARLSEAERIDASTARIAFTAVSGLTDIGITAPLAKPEAAGDYVLRAYQIEVLSGGANNHTADAQSWVEAGAGNDTVRATEGLTYLDGQAGNDVLDGTNGQGILIGGAGNDVFILRGTTDLDRDRVVEAANEGRDEVRSVQNIILSEHANVEIARLIGTASVHVDGTARADTIFGNSAANILGGAAGADTISGGRGADTITGGAGRDTLSAGADTNRDVFVFAALADSGKGKSADTIKEFRSQDVIDLREIDANASLAGDQAFAFGGTKAKALGVWYQVSKGDALVSIDVTGDTKADMQILVDNVTRMNAGDFLL